MKYNLKERFPKSLSLLGLNYGFTQNQFIAIMTLQRSDKIKKLAYEEWQREQDPIYDNSNWRYYLSYVCMDNNENLDNHYKYLLNRN